MLTKDITKCLKIIIFHIVPHPKPLHLSLLTLVMESEIPHVNSMEYPLCKYLHLKCIKLHA